MKETIFHKELIIPSSIEGLNNCLELVRDIGILYSLDYEKIFALHTITVEALENAIIHGNKRNQNLVVKFSISIDKDNILLKIEDEGNGFNIEQVHSPLEKDYIFKESGRGIFFIKFLCSSFKYLGKGNILHVLIDR